jgi:hypothetical protein
MNGAWGTTRNTGAGGWGSTPSTPTTFTATSNTFSTSPGISNTPGQVGGWASNTVGTPTQSTNTTSWGGTPGTAAAPGTPNTPAAGGWGTAQTPTPIGGGSTGWGVTSTAPTPTKSGVGGWGASPASSSGTTSWGTSTPAAGGTTSSGTMCQYFARGQCSYGSNCRNSHGPGNPTNSGIPSSTSMFNTPQKQPLTPGGLPGAITSPLAGAIVPIERPKECEVAKIFGSVPTAHAAPAKKYGVMSIQNNPDVSVPLSIQTCGEDNSVQSWNTSGASIWKGNTPFPVSFLHVQGEYRIIGGIDGTVMFTQGSNPEQSFKGKHTGRVHCGCLFPANNGLIRAATGDFNGLIIIWERDAAGKWNLIGPINSLDGNIVTAIGVINNAGLYAVNFNGKLIRINYNSGELMGQLQLPCKRTVDLYAKDQGLIVVSESSALLALDSNLKPVGQETFENWTLHQVKEVFSFLGNQSIYAVSFTDQNSGEFGIQFVTSNFSKKLAVLYLGKSVDLEFPSSLHTIYDASKKFSCLFCGTSVGKLFYIMMK